MPAESDGPTSQDTGPIGTGSLPLSVGAQRPFFDRLVDGLDRHGVGGQLGGWRKTFDADAGRRAVDLEIEVLDFADGEALKADRHRQLHLDDPLARRAVEAIGGRDVAVFHQPGEVEAHILGKRDRAQVGGENAIDAIATRLKFRRQASVMSVFMRTSSVKTTTSAVRVGLAACRTLTAGAAC